MHGRSVLIIDNDREIVDLLAFYFEEHGYVVDTAVDGHTGVALAQLRKPAAVICDILMDRMHGFEVVQKLRARPELAGTLIIMVSAKAYKPDMDRARALGADHFVVKPFRCDDLLALVEAGATVAAR
ncbi:MAG: response regulator [Candidatus Rokubacteria bacterium]|nr:response regulator [Candidatus Rokubacteria bacterium]